MRRGRGLVAVLLASLLAVGAAACGDDEDNGGGDRTTTAPSREAASGEQQEQQQGQVPAAPQAETIVVRGGEPVGGAQELEYEAGETVRLRVRSDVADEVHVHGYDVSKPVPAGGEVSISFPADIEGIFEIELEERGEPLAELRVNP